MVWLAQEAEVSGGTDEVGSGLPRGRAGVTGRRTSWRSQPAEDF